MAVTTQSNDVLKRELNTFRSHRQELLATSLGKYVLVYGDEIVGTYNTHDDAMDAGYDAFGLETPFMVREVKAADAAVVIYRGSVSSW